MKMCNLYSLQHFAAKRDSAWGWIWFLDENTDERISGKQTQIKIKTRQTNKLKTKSIYGMLGIKKYHEEKENEDEGVRVIEHAH